MFQIDKNFMKANVARTIRFTEPLFEELNQLAADNRISFNILVLQCCRYAIDHMEDED